MRSHSSWLRYVRWLCVTLGLLLALFIGIVGSLPVKASMPFNVLATATPTPTSTSTATPTPTRTPTATPTRTPGRFRNYLPLLFKPMPLPGAPVLNAINNADGDANYVIIWGPAARAQRYELQEDDNSSFSSPTVRYSGSDTSYSVSGQAAGTWHYRVRGCHGGGCGVWSNVQSANVTSCPYADDFSNPSSGWPVSDDPAYRVEYVGGEYRILIKNANWWTGGTPGYRCTDCSIEVEGRFVSANYGSYGILFGLTEAWDAYLFQVSGTQDYSLNKLQSNRWQVLVPWTRSASINAGQATNRLRVVRNGSQIALYANGQLLTTVSDSSFTGNLRVGLAASAYAQGNVDTHFDNFRVCPVTGGLALMSSTLERAEVKSAKAGPRPKP